MLRQSRFIPNLIYAVEQFEKFLIQLGKKAKVCQSAHMWIYCTHPTLRSYLCTVAYNNDQTTRTVHTDQVDHLPVSTPFPLPL